MSDRMHRKYQSVDPTDKEKYLKSSSDIDVESAFLEDHPRVLGNQAIMSLMRQGLIQPGRDLPYLPGNRATIDLVQRSVIQLGRGKKNRRKQSNNAPSGPTLSQEEIKKRILAGQKRRKEEKAAQNSWGAWFVSFLPGGSYSAPSTDEGDDDEIGETLYEDEGDAWEGEAKFGKEEEEAPKEFKNPFEIKELEFDLGDEATLAKKGTSIGDVKASGKRGITSGGESVYSGKGSAEGAYGKAQGQGKVKMSADNLEGEGKLGFLLGASSESKSGTLGWGITENIFEGEGKMETKVGLDGEMAAKLAYDNNTGDFASEGKIGAMLGAKAETTVTIKLKAGGKDLGSTEGKVGIAYGLGGELSGKIEWKGGTLTFANQGKLVAGLGFSYGYKVTFDVKALAQVVPGWLSTLKYWLWDSWELSDDFDEDDILII